MDLTSALRFASGTSRSILITLKRDGRPQSSNVTHAVADGRLLISVTADRAKTRNAARDPRVSLHVLGPDFWSWVAFEGAAALTPPAADPGDETVDALVGYYREASGEHPDWAEYRQAMVEDRRVLMTIAPTHVYGMLPG